MSINLVQISGGVTKDSDLDTFQSGASKVSFSVAVSDVKWDSQTREDVIDTTFVSVERWIPHTATDEDMVYKGDAVYVIGALTQYESKGVKHTRVKAEQVLVTKRGRAGKQALDAVQPPPRAQQGGYQQDPWAAGQTHGGYRSEPPF